MNKKVVGGLFAVLFVTSIVQTSAILKIQKIASAPRVQNVAMTPVEEYPYDFNQQAAVGVLDTNPSDPTPQGYVIYLNANGEVRCMYVESGVLYHNGIPASGTSPSHLSGQGAGAGCNNASVWFLEEPSSGGINITVDSILKNYVVSGGSVPVMQFKLFLLGYMDLSQVTGVMDSNTRSAITSFQKAKSLPQTGTYGPKTQTAIDSAITSIKKPSIISDMGFTFTK